MTDLYHTNDKPSIKTILLFGLRRSGNHFLISTILQQCSNYVHINDVNLDYNSYMKYKNIKQTLQRKDNQWTGFKDTECVIISMENKQINKEEIDKFRTLENCHIIMLLRTPYCHFSSVWQVYKKNQKHLLDIIKLWKIYAKLYLNNDSGILKVLYDEYSINENYMTNILNKIGFDNIKIDKKKNIAYQESSFQNEKEQRNVYKSLENCVFKDDKTFLNLVQDEEIKELYKAIQLIKTN